MVERTFASWSSWVLVFDQLSGLNRRRLAQVAKMATTSSTVVTPISTSTPISRRREILAGAAAAGAAEVVSTVSSVS